MKNGLLNRRFGLLDGERLEALEVSIRWLSRKRTQRPTRGAVWWRCPGLNGGPAAYESAALPTELHRQKGWYVTGRDDTGMIWGVSTVRPQSCWCDLLLFVGYASSAPTQILVPPLRSGRLGA